MTCFDEEPEVRRLMYNRENDRLFEVFRDGQYYECLDNDCDGVTGEAEWEERFRDEKDDQQ